MLLRRVRHLAWRRILDETLVLDLRRRMAYGLNEAGGRLMAWLERSRNVDRLVADLPDELADAVRAFLARLEREELVGVPDVGADDPDPGRDELPIVEDAPRILWVESLPRLAQQGSPPMEIGNVQCLQ